jgi:hypothetical protein
MDSGRRNLTHGTEKLILGALLYKYNTAFHLICYILDSVDMCNSVTTKLWYNNLYFPTSLAEVLILYQHIVFYTALKSLKLCFMYFSSVLPQQITYKSKFLQLHGMLGMFIICHSSA